MNPRPAAPLVLFCAIHACVVTCAAGPALAAGARAGAGPGPAAAAGELSDLRLLPPPGGLPPFTLTLGALALAGAGVAWSRRDRRVPPPSTPVPVEPQQGSPSLASRVASLAAGYRGGTLPLPQLAALLADLVRDALLPPDAGPGAACLTSEELLARLDGGAGADRAALRLAGELLCWCDRVKFAGDARASAGAERALQTAAELVAPAGGGPHAVS